MRGQRIVVTGSSRGLGLEFCRQLLGLGAEVIGTARDPQKAIDLRALEIRIERLDVTDRDSVDAFARSLEGLPIDMLINNAGIGGAENGISNLDLTSVARFLDVNSLGPLRVTQALLPSLRLGKGRRIIQITSKMGSLGVNIEGGYYGYRASKTALNMFNRCLAAELAGQGFVCVALHPGWVRTAIGGTRAPISAQTSVRAMLMVIGRLQRADNGRFLDYTGAEIPW